MPAVDTDPVGMVRGRQGPRGTNELLTQYVNDRPYAASSLLSVAIAETFGSETIAVTTVRKFTILEPSLVVLIGVSGSGWSTRVNRP